MPFPARFAELHPRKFFLETWRNIHAQAVADVEADAEKAGKPRPGKKPKRRILGDVEISFRPLLIFAGAAVFLTLMEYFGDQDTFRRLFPSLADDRRYGEIYRLGYWAVARMTGYGLLPGLLVLLLPGERLADYGLRLKGTGQHLWIYVTLYLAVLPLILIVSFKHDFQTYYPFLKHARGAVWNWRVLLVWELLYAGQFVSLEFFFRGFLLQSLRRQLGVYAIFAAVVPYCMIHYGKPFLEANAAIVAGIVLGTLALRTRSIWCGCLVHVSVAISMDVIALLQRHDLPSVW
jgi:membrane protease YdiL (CAAX protease family)